MTLEEAIKTAIAHETQIEQLYREAFDLVSDQAGKRLFRALAEDEASHIAYLKDQLVQWHQAGKISPEKLEMSVPPRDVVGKGVKEMNVRLKPEDRTDEKQMLSKALAVEIETSRFYEQMASEMPGEGRRLFARFLEIENEHIAMVQAELDYISRTGYWLDFKEFDMEDF